MADQFPTPPVSTREGARLLTELLAVARDFAAREHQLTEEFASRERAIHRAHRERAATNVAALEQTEAELRAAWAEADAAAETFASQREARIHLAYRQSLQALQQLARRKKEQWFGALQLRHLQAERGRPEEQRALETAFGEWSHRLGEERVRLLSLVRLARQSLAGFPSLKRQLRSLESGEEPADANPNRVARMEELEQRLDEGEGRLEEFRSHWLARMFIAWPVLGGTILLAAGGAAGFWAQSTPHRVLAGGIGLLLIILLLALHRWTYHRVRHLGEATAQAVRAAHAAYGACRAASLAQHERDLHELQERYTREFAEIESEWAKGEDVEARFAAKHRRKLENQILRVLNRHHQKVSRLRTWGRETYGPRVEALASEAGTRRQELAGRTEGAMANFTAEQRAAWQQLALEWRQATEPRLARLAELNAAAAEGHQPWDPALLTQWQPPTQFPRAAWLGELTLDLAAHPRPQDSRLAFPGPTELRAPLALNFGEEGSLLLETHGTAPAALADTLQAMLLRLFTLMPAGKLAVTIIDPVSLGQHFAGLMHLADYEEALINRRIWTQRDQIEDRLSELNEHIEKVIQMYLRSDFPTIAAYNRQAGSVAEKLHFLVVADFPHGWSETALARLKSILASGPRCGVWTILHRDLRAQPMEGIAEEDLRQTPLRLEAQNGGWHLIGAPVESRVELEPPPARDLAVPLVHRVGQQSVDSNRVEVPFRHISPMPSERWQSDTTHELRVPIGRTGATKMQYLALGKGTRQHALLAGKTGSGKSTLLHVIITNLALACSPAEVEFYLIDFKKGVEFKCYATQQLPHARVVAIESDREFGLSVLRRVDEELRRRGELFRAAGVQDVPGYRATARAQPLPRTLLIIDEFQEFFVEDDALAQEASLLFDRIVRQGRAFGIHVLLGSQTLGGAYTLARSTLGQMVVRIALQSNEADAYLIMDENNSAPRLLSRPGEGIYNDAAGAVSGNSPFQVVWLPEAERDHLLEEIRIKAETEGTPAPAPVIFEGNAPAEVSQNALLAEALRSHGSAFPPVPRAWLGAPNAIKGPTEITFPRQSGSHVLLVGQRQESAAVLLGLSVLALAAQTPAEARFLILSQAPAGSTEHELFGHLAKSLPEEVTVADGTNFAGHLHAVAEELRQRQADEASNARKPPVFVLIHEWQRFKKLRPEDEFAFSTSSAAEGPNPSADLAEIIAEGSSHGIFLLGSLDTFTSVGRFLSRKALAEFSHRVLFQMSANDSASLMESPAASQLGLHRAALYREQEGAAETFRPYALPASGWWQAALLRLAARSAEKMASP